MSGKPPSEHIMSALPSIAAIERTSRKVRNVPTTDIGDLCTGTYVAGGGAVHSIRSGRSADCRRRANVPCSELREEARRHGLSQGQVTNIDLLRS
jgi:hypothetical protein